MSLFAFEQQIEKLTGGNNSTVDLISYTVISLEPTPKLVEAAQGTGALCGSTYLNLKFSDYLEEKFRGCPFFDDALKAHWMDRFEKDIKRRFRGDTRDPFIIKGFRGFADAPHLGVTNGELHIPVKDLKTIFADTMESITDLVTKQVSTTQRPVMKVVLAGGFGINPYLKIRLEKAMKRSGRKLEVVQIFNR